MAVNVTAKQYGQAALNALSKKIDWLNDDIRVLFTTSAHVPDQDNHVWKSSITNEVAAGNGYTTGGVALANKTLTYIAGTNTVKADADDISLPGCAFSYRNYHVYDNTPATDATRPLIAYGQGDADVIATGGAQNVTWDANGIVTFAAA